ncbi:MAG TPA: potassium channel family protein [Candidatus Polarisedimenticolaceae bacterium]|nr:potassium channel family protein [Candidatus Polarisedimenticolaceae bacterium]
MLGRRPFDRLTDGLGSRYAALLVVVLVSIAIHPLVGVHRWVGWLRDLTYVALVVAVLQAVARHVRVYYASLALGGCAAVVSILTDSFGFDELYPYGAVLRLSLSAVVVVVILVDVFGRDEIDTDAVFGAACAYLLAGLGCGALYALVDWFLPGSFDAPMQPQAVTDRFGPETVESRLVYFSLVTMTTIGYGDVTPVSPPARTLAALQGLLAQLYVAIIVARLVGLELVTRSRRNR